MPEVRPPELVVIPVPSTDGELFVVVDTRTMLPRFNLWSDELSSREEWVATVQRGLEALPCVSESDVRAMLLANGMPPDAIEKQLARAQKIRALAASVPEIPFERITRPGYRNREGQEVIRKTDRCGPDSQRVFVMRCHVCGHEYGAYGCDADIRRCPACQDGPRGVPL